MSLLYAYQLRVMARFCFALSWYFRQMETQPYFRAWVSRTFYRTARGASATCIRGTSKRATLAFMDAVVLSDPIRAFNASAWPLHPYYSV